MFHEWLTPVHPEWRPIVTNCLMTMDLAYLACLRQSDEWLPGTANLLNAFSIPLSQTRYVLLGESPYPRPHSANGYAFWDQAVGSLWGDKGFSKPVNRATSLRNMMKMFLYARGDLSSDFSQDAIARLNQASYWQTGRELFLAFISQGFLLLNACLVFSPGKVTWHARHWRPFMRCLLEQLASFENNIQLILLGQIAKLMSDAPLSSSLVAEHPYNISFITNPEVVAFFKPFDILRAQSHDKINC